MPTAALSSQLDQRVVYVLGQDGKVRMTPVETGDDYGDKTAILSGLRAGALVATDHLQDLRHGQQVRVGRGAAGGVKPDASAQEAAR